MHLRIVLTLALASIAMTAHAQTARVLFDTDRGPMLLELDTARAPVTTQNFLRYVDDGAYNDSLFQRVARNFVVQGGGFKASGVPITRRPNIASERNNGLLNVPGSIAMALSGNPADTSTANSDFFFNTGTNTALDGTFTVFGRVVFGLKTLADMNNNPASNEIPFRMPLLKRAVRVASGEFPILPLHGGAWFDAENPGKGFLIQIGQTAGSETGPIMVVSWYDYFEGRQIWLSGIAPFAWGASSVEVPLQITSGAEFGSAFEPGQVVTDAEWGRITLRFTGCDSGSFSYTSDYGDGTVAVRSLTLPSGSTCIGN